MLGKAIKSVLALSWLMAATTALSNPTHRGDLQEKLTQIICAQPNKMPHTRELWQQEIYDSQITIEVLTGPIDDKANLVAAKQMANTLGHQGYVAGRCSKSNLVWRASSAASTPLLAYSDRLELPAQAMRKTCHRVAVDFAPNHLTNPRLLKMVQSNKIESSLTIHRNYLRNGTIGITCIGNNSNGGGANLWYLVPQAPLSASLPPFADELSEPVLDRAFLTWVNKLRVEQNLTPLSPATPMQLSAHKRFADASHARKRQVLSQANQALQRQQLRIANVIKVTGTNRQELLWSLWNTPHHRRSLLNPNATHLSVVTAADTYNLQTTLLLTNAQTRK